MGVPVLVVHGVGNPRREPFEAAVGRVQARLGPAFELVPAFWGDLGAARAVYDPVLPGADDEGAESVAPGAAQPGAVRSDEERAALISATAAAEAARADGEAPALGAPVRVATPGAGPEAIEAIVRQELPGTTHLRTVSNPEVLAAVGELVGRGAGAAMSDGGEEAPAFLGRIVGGLLDGADRLVGAVVGEVLGNVNRDIRSNLVPGVAGFLGDVLAYQHHRRAIQERLWETIEAHPATRGAGGPERPVHVMAHSLGGVIGFHAATAADTGRRLHIDGFVTFGSQSGFFHLLDPRASGLAPFEAGHPVPVPGTIRRWTNLWEPLDPLAFLAGPVFRLDDGAGGSRRPDDRATAHLASSGFFTHGTYWDCDELLDSVRATFT